jgi:hypothetical protein
MRATMPPLGTPLDKSHAMLANCAAYYVMNAGGGTILKDIFNPIASHDGVLSLSTINTSSGQRATYNKGGCEFDGLEGYIQLGWSLDLSKPFSFALLQKYFTDTNGTYFCSANPATGANGEIIRSLTTGNIRIFSGSNFSDFTAGRTPYNTELIGYTNTAISGGGAGVQTVYRNGINLGTAARSRSTSTDHNITIGVPKGTNPSEVFYAGIMYQCIFWYRILTATEMRYLYANPYCMFIDKKSGL